MHYRLTIANVLSLGVSDADVHKFQSCLRHSEINWNRDPALKRRPCPDGMREQVAGATKESGIDPLTKGTSVESGLFQQKEKTGHPVKERWSIPSSAFLPDVALVA